MRNPVNNTTFPGPLHIDLPLLTCALIDLPMKDESICDNFPEFNNDTQVHCHFQGKYLTGESIDDISSTGHTICFLLWVLILIIGTFATVGNFIIIIVLQRKNTGRGFDKFLVGLAISDLTCSIFTVMGATCITTFHQNWDRGRITQYIYLYTVPLSITARSASSFVTLVITIERYLVIAYPEKFSKWFTIRRTSFITIVTIFFAILIGIPRLSSFKIERNTILQNVTKFQNLDYIILSTDLYKIWYMTLYGFFDKIDFWVPLPLLLIFNGLVYYHIRQFAARRKELSLKHRRDIRAARMFVPVVIVLLLCNGMSIIHYAFIFNNIIYREIRLASALSFVVNASVNLPIYYFGGTGFRKETKGLIRRMMPCLHIPVVVTDIQMQQETSKTAGNTGDSSYDFERERYF